MREGRREGGTERGGRGGEEEGETEVGGNSGWEGGNGEEEEERMESKAGKLQ